MNASLQALAHVASKEKKTIIGLMSGTSLDGLDIARCEITGTGQQTRLELKQFKTCPYPREVAERLARTVSVETVDLEELTLVNSWLAGYHADLVLEALEEWETEPGEVDCIASHGQTVYHAPAAEHGRKGMPDATLQIGDGDHIARRTGILTLSDFRQKHTAAGGEGAPMVSLVDKLLFTHDTEDRILLNIGGIANFSYLPSKKAGGDRAYGFVTTDTGPGNTLINAACRQYFDEEFDRDGQIAASGTVHTGLLRALREDNYFDKPFPRTTGPEKFNLDWVWKRCNNAGIKDLFYEDLIATLTWFTAETIAEAIQSVDSRTAPAVYLSGGGMHNKTMIGWLDRLMESYPLRSFEQIGYNPDAKEAASFAVLANEALSGEGFLITPKKGAARRVNFGKISLPV